MSALTIDWGDRGTLKTFCTRGTLKTFCTSHLEKDPNETTKGICASMEAKKLHEMSGWVCLKSDETSNTSNL